MENEIAVYLESGQRKVFAGALAWPGWARSGRSEEAALQALADYAPRYAKIFKATGMRFPDTPNVETLAVVARLPGSASTDFGAPGAMHDGLPEKGPRGGAIWTPRYFVRRTAWHTVDHLWEIEDRVT